MPNVYANKSVVVRVNGMPISIKENQPFDANEAVVREHPWLFESPIEAATAVPGERRTTVRK